MSLRRTVTTATVVAASWVALGASSPALAVCDAYSGGCPSPTPISGGDGGAGTGTDTGAGSDTTDDQGGAGTGAGTGGTLSNPSTLPFTGGELVLLTVLGAGTLAGGTALVVAGRRRPHAPA